MVVRHPSNKQGEQLKFGLRRSAAGLAVASALLTPLALPTSAQANDANVSPKLCDDDYLGWRMKFHYRSNYEGAWIRFGYTEENFGANDGTAGHLIFNFCKGTGAGAGKNVKNHAAAATNDKNGGCTGRVYFHSQFKGVYDDVNSGRRKLANTYNENASFKWRGPEC
ncbi:hypothetical protein [Streptomyces sp. NPDC048650]|uniref:hypothetical protein n=1 Tax=unclassified Streptomyces TaxID=2593676 RepID=UPI0037236429